MTWYSERGLFVLLGIICFVALIMGVAPSWVGSTTNYTIVEDTVYAHNLTQNITGYADDVTFTFNVNNQFNLSWQNATGTFNVTSSEISDWIVLNGSSGILNFSPVYDNQTGFFELPIQAKNISDNEAATTIFEFILNATNDAPVFVNISANYTFLSNGVNPGHNITVSDEENHYPFLFEINFTDCSHASWTGIPDGQNCTLFNLTNFTGTSAQLNYSGLGADVGIYNATVNVTEVPHSCPHSFCETSSYETLQSIQYNITIEVLAGMEINVSSCYNQKFTQGTSENCSISIRTRGSSDTFNLTSVSDFTNYAGTPTNTSWFYPITEHTATNNLVELNISVNGTLAEVGNWTINLSSSILGSSADFNWTLLVIFVNWTGNSNLTLANFNAAYNTSVDLNYTIAFNVTDPDFDIEDKNFYNESPVMNITVINLSSGSAVTGFFSFSRGTASNQIMPINVTFSPNSSHIGTYNVTINATDQSGHMRYDSFNLTIVSNNFPYWNATSYVYNFTVNATQATTFDNITSLNLTRAHANDSDITDTLTFSNDSNAPSRFILSSAGILNFYPWKEDVGFWNVSVTVTDQLGLSNTSQWIFNISNVNSIPVIDESASDVNGVSFSPGYNFTVNVSEESNISFQFIDNDLFITDSQITNNNAYNESFTVVANITNTSVMPSPLSFSFSFDAETQNRSMYLASFTPNVSSLGNYTVVLNVTDASNASDTVSFNLTVGGPNNLPVIQNITTPETSYLIENFNFTINATDLEDDAFGRTLNYTLVATNGGPDLNIGLTNGSVTFNFSANTSYVGNWTYNVTVNDSTGDNTTASFNILVNGYIDVNMPINGAVFNGTENAITTFDIDVNDSIDGLNLTYYIYFDNITYYNASGENSFNYSNITFRDSGSFIYNSSDNMTFNYTFLYADETYALLKNMTFVVFREGFASLNKTMNYKVNVTHANDPLTASANFSNVETFTGTGFSADLNDYFSDTDASDSFYNQIVNFSMNQSDDTNVTLSATISGWDFSVDTSSTGTYNVSIIGNEKNLSTGASIRNVSSNWFTITFSDPPSDDGGSSSSSSGGGGGSSSTTTVLEYFSIKIIVPGDISISPDNFIDVNFSVLNNGDIDLSGIDLSSIVELNGLINQDISIDLSDSYIESLKPGESQEFRMRVFANTEAVGEYRVLIYGNVTAPKFSDWGELYVQVKSLDESQLAGLLVFTEKLISENPECLELTEVYEEGKTAFDVQNFAETERILNEVIRACEEAISANDQISFFDERVRVSFMFSLFVTSVLFIAGFVYYFYRRIKFKKLIDQDYI